MLRLLGGECMSRFINHFYSFFPKLQKDFKIYDGEVFSHVYDGDFYKNIPYDKYINFNPDYQINNLIYIKDFDAVPDDSNVNNANSINCAINECSKNGGGIVVVGGGNYFTGTVYMKSNVTLYIEKDSSITASHNINDFTENALVYADNCDNIAIFGPGKICGEGNFFSLKPHLPPKTEPFPETLDVWDMRQEYRKRIRFAHKSKYGYLVLFKNCKDLKLHNLIIENAAMWTVNINSCDNVEISNVVIDNNRHVANSDGIDICGSSNVVVHNCFVSTADDGIVLKNNLGVTTSGDDGLVIKNNLDVACKKGMSNIYIHDCDNNSQRDKVKSILSLIKENQQLMCEEYKYQDIFNMNKNNRDELIPVLSTASCCLLFLSEKTQNIYSKDPAFVELIELLLKEHINIIPITTGTTVDMQLFPESISQLHSISIGDGSLAEKLLYSLHKRILDNDLPEALMDPQNDDYSDALQKCTARQLFSYAIKLLYGFGMEKDSKLAVEILSCLIGNDSFYPETIIINDKKTEGLFIFLESIKTYLEELCSNVNPKTAHTDLKKILEYGKLVSRLSKVHFNYGLDNTLETIKKVMSYYYERGFSLISGMWLLEAFWNEADRYAQNREFEKMLDKLFEVLTIADNIYEKYNNTEALDYLFRATSILQLYKTMKPSIYQKISEIKILDEYEKSNTFRPDHKEQPRKAFEIKKLQYLDYRYVSCDELGIEKAFKKFTENVSFENVECIHASMIATSHLLIDIKFNRINDEMSKWYTRHLEYVLNALPKNLEQSNHLIMLNMINLGELLQLLQNSYVNSDSQSVLYLAEYMEQMWNSNEPIFFECDKSQIYAALITKYEANREYELSDKYVFKLFDIVQERDKNDNEKIKKMIIDIYNYGCEREQNSMPEQALALFYYGWNVCKKFRFLPNRCCDLLINKITSLDPKDELIPSPDLLEKFRDMWPEGPGEMDIVRPLASREIYEILGNMEDEDYNKIPDNVICAIRSQMNIYYNFSVDTKKSLKEQKMLYFTRKFLSEMYEKYWS